MQNYTTIKRISFTKKTHGEVFGFHDNVLRFMKTAKAEKIGCDDEVETAYESAVAALQSLVLRDEKNDLTAEIEAADARRDAAVSAVFALIDAAAASLFEDLSAPGRLLLDKLRMYRGITTHAFSVETGEILGMIGVLYAHRSEMEKISRLSDTVDLLAVNNEQFNVLLEARNAAPTSKAESDAKRNEAQRVYEAIVVRANAAVVLLPSAEATEFVTKVNSEIDRTNEAYNRRVGVIKASKTDSNPPAEA